MDTMIVRKLEDLLLVTVPTDLMDAEILSLRRQILDKIRQHRPIWVLLDFSEVELCDSYFGRFIESMARMSRLMGSDVVVCGLGDAIVETMVEMGLTLTDIQTVLDLDEALELSRRQYRLKANRKSLTINDFESYLDLDITKNRDRDSGEYLAAYLEAHQTATPDQSNTPESKRGQR